MHINELPDVVLARILYWACSGPGYPSSCHYRLKTWRTKLALLSVCRVWRELALPNVHMISFVGCIHIRKLNNGDGGPIRNYADLEDSDYDVSGSEDSNSEGSDSEGSDTHSRFNESDDLEVETYTVKTNLDVIDKKGGKCWPRTVQIFVKTSCDPAHSLQGIIEKIRCHVSLLKNVRRVELIYELCFGDDIVTDEPPSIAETSLIGEELSQLIPSVKYIEWIDFTNAPSVILRFAKSLIKGYAHQLTGFNYPQMALEDVPSFSDNLRHVEVDGHNLNMKCMPQVCAESLTYLDLNPIRSKLDWSSFESNGSPGCLNFANLKWLRLRVGEVTYNQKYPVRKFNYKVIAPKLETVITQLCPSELSFLSSIHGSTTIRNVELRMEWGYLHFTKFNLDRARELFASYAKDTQEEFQAVDKYAYMNDILKIHNLAEYSRVLIGFGRKPLNIMKMDWKYLQDIEIVCPIHVNSLKALFSRMPNLEKIHFGILESKVCGELISDIQDEESIVEPISLNLKHISARNSYKCTEDEVDRLNVYLGKIFPRA